MSWLLLLTLFPPTGPVAVSPTASPLAALSTDPAARGTEEAPARETVSRQTPVVGPGQLVRWSAPGTVACRHAQTTWEPLGETCWYPVDLLAASGVRVVERRRDGRWESALVRVGEYPYSVQRLEIRDRSKVDLSTGDLERARREGRRVAALWSRVTRRRFTLPLKTPLAQMPVSGRFGARRVINGEPRSPHSGADYRADAGTPVRAAADGTVVLAEEHFFAGNSVFLDHGDGLITMYFHLAEISVASGQDVAAGQTLGRVGSTGRSTGPHLHFGARWRGARVDPELLLHPERAPLLKP